MLYLLTSSNSFPHQKIEKVRVINLTQGGLKAMEELAKLEAERGTPGYLAGDGKNGGKTPDTLASMEQVGRKKERIASNEMCTFLILNISSLQLIPVNMIAYRSQYGSVNPAAIVGPAIVATMVSTVVAIIFCKIMDRMR